MALSGLSFLEEMASMNGVSADSSLAEDEEKLFNLFFSDGLEPSLGLQASGDFPELTSITEPSDTAEDSAEALAPPPPPPSRRKAPQAAPRSLKAASQSQEKSRRAQLRYREKQRQQRDDDRRTIEELSARVAALETQSAELARRNQLLTSVAAIKEAQNPVQPAPVNAAESRLGPVAAQHLAAALTLLRKQDDNPLDPVNLEDSIWDNCGDEISPLVAGLLLSGGDSGDTPDGQRLIKAMTHLNQAMASMWMTRPGAVRTLLRHMHQRSAARHGLPPPDLWPKVLKAMNLSEAQHASLRDARRQLLMQTQTLRRQRAHLLQQLNTPLPGDSDVLNTEALSQASEAAADLEKALAQEHRALGDFMIAFHAVVQPIEMARAKLAVWPHSLDMMFICKQLDDDHPGPGPAV